MIPTTSLITRRTAKGQITSVHRVDLPTGQSFTLQVTAKHDGYDQQSYTEVQTLLPEGSWSKERLVWITGAEMAASKDANVYKPEHAANLMRDEARALAEAVVILTAAHATRR